jgi:hypothetical protein
MGNAYNIYNVDYSTAQRNAGLLAALCDSGYQFLKSFNLYKLTVSVTVANLIGVNDAATKERVKTLCWNAAQGGLVVTILGHTDTVATWTPILDALQEMQNEGIVTVTSAQLVAKTIRSSPWTYNAGTGISTRSYTSYHDFHIKPGSPCINTGVLASLPTKDAENKVWISTDMGAYAFRNTGFIRF